MAPEDGFIGGERGDRGQIVPGPRCSGVPCVIALMFIHVRLAQAR